MTPEQKAELLKMLQEIDPASLRVIKYSASGGHRCSDSTSLMTCCGTQRCHACHIPHLKVVHGEAAFQAYEKFARAGTLTWQVRAYKMPLEPKPTRTTKVNKNRPTRAPIAKPVESARNLANRIKDEDLDSVIAMLEARIKK